MRDKMCFVEPPPAAAAQNILCQNNAPQESVFVDLVVKEKLYFNKK